MGYPHIYPVYHPAGRGIYGGGRIYRHGNRKGGHQPVHVQKVGFGVEAVFYAEPISDIMACAAASTTFIMLSGQVLKDKRRLF